MLCYLTKESRAGGLVIFLVGTAESPPVHPPTSGCTFCLLYLQISAARKEHWLRHHRRRFREDEIHWKAPSIHLHCSSIHTSFARVPPTLSSPFALHLHSCLTHESERERERVRQSLVPPPPLQTASRPAHPRAGTCPRWSSWSCSSYTETLVSYHIRRRQAHTIIFCLLVFT
jgi:hypothetical protein